MKVARGFTLGPFDARYTLTMPATAPPYRCGTLTHDNVDVAPHGAVRASDLMGEPPIMPRLTETDLMIERLRALNEGEKPDLDPNEGDST